MPRREHRPAGWARAVSWRMLSRMEKPNTEPRSPWMRVAETSTGSVPPRSSRMIEEEAAHGPVLAEIGHQDLEIDRRAAQPVVQRLAPRAAPARPLRTRSRNARIGLDDLARHRRRTKPLRPAGCGRMAKQARDGRQPCPDPAVGQEAYEKVGLSREFPPPGRVSPRTGGGGETRFFQHDGADLEGLLAPLARGSRSVFRSARA